MHKLKIVIFTIGAVGLSAATSAAEDHFTAEDVFELEYAADPQISPDGNKVLYVRRSNDIMTDRTRSNIWMVNADGSGHRPILSGRNSFSSPRWSSDGSRIAYISSEEGSPQLYVRWMDSGQTALVTNLTASPSALSWSPDGRWLAFTMQVPAEKKNLAKPRKKPEGAKWSEPVKVIDSVIYRFDGRGFIEPAYTHIFVVPADGGTARQLTEGAFNHSGPLSWTNDSAHILFSANRHDEWEFETIESDIFRIAVADGTLTRLTDEPGAENSPEMSPNGRLIAFTKAENKALAYRNTRLATMRTDGSDIKVITGDLDRSISGIAWAGNSRNIFFQYDDRAVRKVALADLAGDFDDVATGLGGTTLGRPYTSGDYSVSGDGTVAYTKGSPHRPADLWVAGRQLTHLNDDLFAGKKLGDVHEIIYNSSFDGEEIQGWYVTPPGYDPAKKYPVILEIHGGPHASYGANFAAEIQRYAAEGYVVFYDNHRGSTSYGERFALLLQYKYSSPEDFADHMSGLDALIERGIVDPDQLYITGGSAGGIAAAYAVGLTDRFRAAAVAKPIINWISKTLTGDIYNFQIRHQFPGMPWEEFEHYWQRSPLSLVGNVTTPTLLMTGEEDYRTPISEAEQFYQALKLRRIDTVMIRVPGSPHGIAGRPSRLNAKVDNILAWFEKYRPDSE